MFNNIFCEIKGKKVIHWVGWGTVLITSWKCNFSIYFDIQVYYLNIQAITTFYLFYWLFMCSLYSFIFLPYNCSPEKWRFLALKWPLLPQFSTYRHRTGFIVKRKQVQRFIYKLVKKNIIFKAAYFAKKKNMRFSKNSLKFIQFFFKNLKLGIRIYVLNALITSNLLYL